MNKLLSPFTKGDFQLKNHIVMAPMTRSRATGNIPNELMATYYKQRAGAGLIITEGTSPSPEGLGYTSIPGIFTKDQIDGWKKTTEAVHQDGSKIFVQLMHSGRIAHESNLPEGSVVVGPSAIKAAGQIFTMSGMQEHSTPIALSTEQVKNTVADFVQSAKNAIEAGFDGIEIHAANGYLPEQFLNPNVNVRTDEYGRSAQNRIRFVVEVTKGIADAIGADKVGIRISPFSQSSDLAPYPQNEVIETYTLLTQEMESLNLAYMHLSANGNIPKELYSIIRTHFSNTVILCNGLTPETGEKALSEGFADVVAFGRSFISNPDFTSRIEKGAELTPLTDFDTLYSPGAKGYTDYPTLEEELSLK
ncbi:alkene reductase [Chryseobacterium sp. A321]